MDSFTHSFVHSLNKLVLSGECVPGTVPGAKAKGVDRRNDPPASCSLRSRGGK